MEYVKQPILRISSVAKVALFHSKTVVPKGKYLTPSFENVAKFREEIELVEKDREEKTKNV